MKDVFKLAICQMKVTDDKDINLSKAAEMLQEAYKNGSDIAVLPEMFNCPYANNKFWEYGESIKDGRTVKTIARLAEQLEMYIVAGSLPEICGDKIYNTSLVFDRRGDIIGKHRKMHLFDIDIPGKVFFKESDTLAPGSSVTVVDTEFCRIGIAICYDMRFPELARLMTLDGAKLVIVPAAFNMTTGPAHWELLVRTRALDNQVYFAAASPARDREASYVAYGHSMVASPWGDVISDAGEDEKVIFANIDLREVERVRNELPLLKHMRTDRYSTAKK